MSTVRLEPLLAQGARASRPGRLPLPNMICQRILVVELHSPLNLLAHGVSRDPSRCPSVCWPWVLAFGPQQTLSVARNVMVRGLSKGPIIFADLCKSSA
jgi:hypothetical protein